eukprot:Ihof_evm2s823 gene=Ihof_evmTU2s823
MEQENEENEDLLSGIPLEELLQDDFAEEIIPSIIPPSFHPPSSHFHPTQGSLTAIHSASSSQSIHKSTCEMLPLEP